MRRVLVLLSMLVASVGVAQAPEPTADAQAATPEGPTEADLARARVRFREGVSAAERGDYASAARAFRDALAVRDAVAVRFNLASALYELEEDAEAFRLARNLQTDPESPSELRERAAFLERELRERNAVVSVQLGGLADGARLGERDLTQDELGTPLLVAPGEVELVGLRGNEVVTRRALHLRRGGDVYVDVSVVPTPAELA
ncbi:MAG: hypothetical protein H6723_16580, partial [Sandaracinus sp.]|nr:hypothetical protein [Sandaracinus sp.]